eukprot:jgi/Astpho2/9385/Aster-x0852
MPAGPIWSYPPTFLHGVAKAPGISFLNVFTAVGGFSVMSPGGYGDFDDKDSVNFFKKKPAEDQMTTEEPPEPKLAT